MCADTTTSLMRRTQESVTHVPSLHPVIFLSLDGRGLTSLPRTAIRGEGESRRPLSSFPRSKACPVPRYGARIHALIAKPGTHAAKRQCKGEPLRSQCSAGACPPLRSATRRQPPPTNHPASQQTPTVPVEAGFKPAWGGGKWQHPPAGRFVIPSPPHRHSRAEPAPYPDTGRESTHQSPTVKRRSRPGITNKVNVARGLVPRYGLPHAGNRSD